MTDGLEYSKTMIKAAQPSRIEYTVKTLDDGRIYVEVPKLSQSPYRII
jgi:hypothetical protein